MLAINRPYGTMDINSTCHKTGSRSQTIHHARESISSLPDFTFLITGISMSDPLVIINAAVSTVTKLASLAGTIKNAELKLLVADLTLEIAQTKTTMAALIDENRELRSTITKHSTPKINVVLKDGLYYTDNNDGPFCTACFDGKEKLVRVTELHGHFKLMGKYKCPICDTKYGEPSR